MTIRASVFFEYFKPDCGWSETHYFSGSDLSSAQDKLVAMRDPRKGILPDSCTIVGWRVALIGTKRTMSTYRTTGAEGQGTYTADVEPTEPWSALLMQFGKLPQLRVPRFLHAIPQDCVTQGEYTPSAAFPAALSAYTTLVVGSTVIYAKDPAAGGPKQEFAPTVFNPLRMTTHHVGRPLGLLRGRRKRR